MKANPNVVALLAKAQNFVLGLHKELGVDIPDADVAKITTLDKCVGYLVSRVKHS